MLSDVLAPSFGCSPLPLIFGHDFVFFSVATGKAVFADVPLVSPGEARDAQHGRFELSLHHHLCPRLERKKGKFLMSVISPY